MISITNLKREFKVNKFETFEALRGISFEVEEGEIFGLLGPNGAGKTTTIKILSTMLAPTSGKAKVLGYDTFGQEKLIREHINFVFGGERSLYWRLSAIDNLAYFADLYKIPKKNQKKLIIKSLKQVGLNDVGQKKVETFSKGMKQRLQIARATLNKPKIIFLDEPSIGLDPIGASELRILIKELAEQGTTILLTTHYLAEAENLCDRIAFINNGKIIAMDNIDGLRNLISQNRQKEILENKKNINIEKDKLELAITLEDIYLELMGEG